MTKTHETLLRVIACCSLTGCATAAPIVTATSPAPSALVGSLGSVSITFNEAVSGVDAADLRIQGVPAASVSGSGAGPYVFSFTTPPPGTVSLEWTDDHGISGIGTGPFEPLGAWAYTLVDNIAPAIALIQASVPGQSVKHVAPPPSSTVATLTQATVRFTEAVTGVDAADFRINGNAATSVSGNEHGPYQFVFPAPPDGPVTFSWMTSPGIIDANGNAFVPDGWSVTKSAAPGTVVISEFLAANGGASSTTTNGTRDEDFDLSPWIELHNPGTSAVDLTGWTLTNDADDPAMWIFPQRTLAAGARLVVWASGKNRRPSSGHLHTNFTLDVEGGYLALHRPDQPGGAAVSKFPANHPSVSSYPPQRHDYSYGSRSGDGAARYFSPPSVNQSAYTLPTSTNPSPAPPEVPTGAANSNSALASIALEPTANVDHGFFNTAFSVILSCEQAGAQIRYTTNGSAPLATDPVYTAPISIQGTTVLRFAAFASDSVPSAAVTRTYLFADQVTNQMSPPYTGASAPPAVGNQTLPQTWGTQSGFGFPGLITHLAANQIPADYGMDSKIHADPNRYDDAGNLNASGKTNLERIRAGLRKLPVLSVVMDNNDMFGGNGLYPTSSSTNKTDNTKPCSLEMFDAAGNTYFISGAGIDNHGNASRDPYKNPKHGYTLRFKGRYGNGRLNGAVFPDSPVEEWDKFVLRADFGFSWLHWDGNLQRPRGIRIRDPFCKDSFRDMGRIAGHSRFVNLFINGVYWGTYDITEDEDEDFSASYFGGDKSAQDVIEQNNLKSGSWTTYREIKRILGWTGAPTYNTAPSATKLASSFTNPEYEEIKQHLDVPWHCDYTILHYFIGHEDWGTQAAYDKNWYAVRPPGGKFRYLPWDMENVMNSPTLNRVSGATYPPTAIQPRLVKNPQYLLDFADRVNLHMINPDGALLPSACISRLDRWSAIMNADAMCLESARWGDYRDRVHVYANDTNVIYTWNGSWFENGARATTGTSWLAEIGRMRNSYFPVRTNNVLGQFRSAGLYPALNAPEFANASDDAPTGSKQVPAGFLLKMRLPSPAPSGTTSAGSIYYTLDGSDPRTAYDNSGTPAPGALAYTAPLPLNSTVTVKARALNGSTWSALRENTFTVGSASPRIVISEIHYRPSSGGTSREFIEILNTGSTAADLSLWRFEGIGFIIPFGTRLAPGARLVIANNDNPAAFAAAYPTVIVNGYFSGSLDNGGERIRLLDREGNTVCSVHYRDQSPWPTTPDGGGPSLELVPGAVDPTLASHWQPSAANHGSPGQPNAPGPAATLILSEFTSGSGGFIEIINASASPASTSGWSLRTSGPSETWASLPIASASLAPGQHLAIPMPLDSTQGALVLLDPIGRPRDGTRYGPQAAGYGFSRIAGSWRLSTPTPGVANTAATTGDPAVLRLNEFLANPVPGGEDWLEIANPSTMPVDLGGLRTGPAEDPREILCPTAIAPGSHLRLFIAANSDRGDTLDSSLPATGGTLVLGRVSGPVIDSRSYTQQTEDRSEGRLPNATGTFAPLPFASPAAPNHGVLTEVPLFHEVLVKNRSGDIHPWAGRSAWFELRNPSAASISLTGWRIRGIGDDSDEWTVPAGLSMEPGAILPIWADPAAPRSTQPAAHLNCGLGIDSETEHDYSRWGLEIVTPDGRIADRITWGLQVPDQSIGRDGTGVWKLLVTPTRGTANSTAAALGPATVIRINEWTGRDIDPGGGVVSQFSELFNPSSLAVDLTSLWLGDSPGEADLRKWRFPALSFIGPASHALLLPSTGGNDPARIGFNLSRGGEMLILSNNNATVDSVSFGLASATRSLGRSPDGSSAISELLPTPGASNIPAGGPAPVFRLHPRSRSVPAGSSLVLSASALPATSYQWLRNGSPLPGANQPTFALQPLTSYDDATYHCVASNGSLSTSSAPATVTVIHNYSLLASERSLGPANADDDSDGVPNAIEFLTGSDPLVAGASAGSTTFAGTPANPLLRHTLRLNSRAAWSGLRGEISANCLIWTRNDPLSIETLTTHPNGDRTVRYTFPAASSASRAFLRLALDP